MVINIKGYTCPFCNNDLESRFSKCFNIYCQGKSFNLGNLIIYRLNLELGIGRIINILEIPTSKSLDEEDTQYFHKFKVRFENNVTKIIHPIDLIHYVFQLNERVVTRNGVGVINSDDFLLEDGKISYEVIYPNGKVDQASENDIFSIYEEPIKKILKHKKFDPPRQFLIKYWANLFHSFYTSYQIKCITNSRLTLMPHQINVAHRLSEEYFPRVILADEVGLGKTIEAGIYVKEMMSRNLAERVLIIVPATLVRQWQFEMENKFNMEFIIYDGQRVKELEKNGSIYSQEKLKNPFYYDNCIICSLQFARNPKYADLLSQVSWDIIIFDEAHHLRRYITNLTTGNYRETLNYILARKLSDSCQSLLLLTATPLQIHSFELFSLIELIKGGIFENFSDFEHFRKNMPFINLLISNLNNIDHLNNFEVKSNIKLLKSLGYIKKRDSDLQILESLKLDNYKFELIKKVEKDHTLSKFLIRNRKKNVFFEEYLNKRIVQTIMVHPKPEELEIYNEIRLYLAKIYNTSVSKTNVGLGFIITTLQKLLTSSKIAFLKSIERRLEQIERSKSLSSQLDDIFEEDPEFFESELEDEYLDSEISFNSNQEKEPLLNLTNQERILKHFYEKLLSIPYDSKSDALLNLMESIYKDNPKEKILVFTQFVDTLFYLRDLLSNKGYSTYIFYGGMDKFEKQHSVEKFRADDNFSILLSTEIGGEGRNFQFCRVLMNYDLPWNPMKLEQRIGRLDRIGQQSKEIFIYNFFLEGTVESDIIFALDKRINLYEESIGQLEPIIGNIEKDMKDLIFAPEKEKRRKLNEFTRKLDMEVKKAKEIEVQLDDLMIDKKSFQVDDLVTSMDSCEEVKLSHNELFLLIKYFFKLKGGKYGFFIPEKENTVNSEVTIKISDELLNNERYRLFEEYSGTFGLNLAREKEEIDFFALGHPLITALIEYCESSSFRGSFTSLFLKKSVLPLTLLKQLNHHEYLYLFVFNIKFQGYIIENQYNAMIIDKDGKEIDHLAEYCLDIGQYENVFDFSNSDYKNIDINLERIDNLREHAKKILKRKTSAWKKEIKRLNDKIFEIEKSKNERIHQNKRRLLKYKRENLLLKLERKERQRPTKRQMQNIYDLTDKKKQEEKLENINSLEEEIRFIKKDIEIVERKLDDLEFQFEDAKKDLEKQNLAKFYTNLNSFAIIKLVP